MVKFNKPLSEVYSYEGKAADEAIAATTHLCIAAHQDDVEFMSYSGIAECFGANDKNFSAVIMTNGSGSPRAGIYGDYSDADMMAVRRKEQKKAAFVGEYSALCLLDYPSSEIKDAKNDDTVADIVKILKIARPRVIYTHNLADKHDTHVSVALRVIAALQRLAGEYRPEKVYGCEVWRALDWMSDDKKVRLNTGLRENLAAAVMGVFDSQISGGKRYDSAVFGRRAANATFADDHAVDAETSVNYAMDLMPLIEPGADVQRFIEDYIDEFKRDVANKIGKFGK